MDSNFQVKITADLSDLQARIKSVEGTLNSLQAVSTNATKKLQVGMDNAAVSVERLNNNANRGRLAAFAFGQVIRDAGFFSQNFGLGVLAISNNIPILIDQLVLLTGITGAAGIAISLLGSFLTAGLTIFAYWAQSVQSDGKGVGQEIQRMALDSQTYIGQLVDYLSKPPASTLLSTVIGGFREGFELLKQIAQAGIEFIIAVWDRFGTEISMVMDFIYQIVYNQMNNALNIIKLVTGLIKGDWEGVWEAIKQITFNVINSIISAMQTLLVGVSTVIGGIVGVTNAAAGASITAAGKYIATLGNQLKFVKKDTSDFNFVFKDFIKGLSFAAPATKGASDGLGKIGKETLIVDKRLNKVTDTLNKYHDRLQDIELTAGISPLEIKKGSAEALADLIVDLQKIAGTERTVALLKTEFNKLNGELEFAKNFGPIEFDIESDPAIIALQKFSDAVDSIFRNGILDTITSTMSAVGEAIAAGGNIGDSFGNALLGSIGGVLIEFGKLIIATAIAGEAFSLAMQQLFSPEQWGIALVAGAALILAGSTIRGFASKKAGGGGNGNGNANSGNMYGSFRPFAVGGIVSGPTNALIGEYPGARNNPEVVAPLDKLTGIIAGSIGGRDMGGTLSTRISGNDLVILLDRASKNRKNYF
jgi:hypothetical protein